MLSTASVTTMLPVKDIDRARAFYEGCLGLTPGGFKPDGKFVYSVGGTTLALFPKPDGTKADHTAISFQVNDIAAPIAGQTEPSAGHAARVLAFVDDWDRSAPMLIHCWAGISRSTASMFMALCKLNPERDETDILARMRRLAPHIAPTRLLTAHADDLLGRGGRMVDALDAVGPARPASEGYLFELPAFIPGEAD